MSNSINIWPIVSKWRRFSSIAKMRRNLVGIQKRKPKIYRCSLLISRPSHSILLSNNLWSLELILITWCHLNCYFYSNPWNFGKNANFISIRIKVNKSDCDAGSHWNWILHNYDSKWTLNSPNDIHLAIIARPKLRRKAMERNIFRWMWFSILKMRKREKKRTIWTQ